MGMLWDYWYAPVATQEGVGEVGQHQKEGNMNEDNL